MYAVYDNRKKELYGIKGVKMHNLISLYDKEKAELSCEGFNNYEKYKGRKECNEAVLVLIDGKENLDEDSVWFGSDNPKCRMYPDMIKRGFFVIAADKKEFVTFLHTNKSGFPETVSTSPDYTILYEDYAQAARARAVCQAVDPEQEFTLGIVQIRRMNHVSEK